MENAQLELLRRLTLSDEHVLSQVISGQTVERPLLDEKTSALVRLAGQVAMEGNVASFQWAVDAALAAGAEDAEIVDVLLAIASIVGLARVNAATRTLATALGYPLDRER